ncbi:oligosaccharide flippase family protein [Kocuria sediminis]|uniref:Oligosaccharide flippase family protein n=1 Tax=Kocuria sediminis TaxID=1038857 RepID=A0A6N8GW29_9MICC|nr:lipopolysaccharide biosynthesis protein [Kocuria sediminis]MUN64994.1 oligosaccharide flippase family protein [Kocuria sediminis]
MSRNVLVQLTGIIAGRLVAAAAQALTIVLLARWSQPADFGLVISVQTILTALTVVVSLGIPQYIGVMRARNPHSPDISGLMHLSSRNSVFAAATFATALFIWGLIDLEVMHFVPLGLALGIQLHANAWDAIVVCDRQIGLFSSNLILRRTFGLTILIFLYLLQMPTVPAYCIAVLLSEVLYVTRIRKGSFFSPKKGSRIGAHAVFRSSKHFWVDAMSGQLRLLDVAVTGLLLGPVASGYLAVPSRIASPMMLVPSSFATLILPRVSAGGGRTARRSLHLAIGVTALLAVVLTLVAWYLPGLTLFFLGNEYLPSVPVTRIYFAGLVFLSLVYMLGAILQGLGLQSAVGKNSIVFSGLSLVMLSLGGYFYGLEAAAAGYVFATLGQVFGLVFLYLFHYRGSGSHISSASTARPRCTIASAPRDKGRHAGRSFM